MKTTIVKPEFTPVSLTITFESQEELNNFGCLCNTFAIANSLTVPHYNQLEKLGADVTTGQAELNTRLKRAFNR